MDKELTLDMIPAWDNNECQIFLDERVSDLGVEITTKEITQKQLEDLGINPDNDIIYIKNLNLICKHLKLNTDSQYVELLSTFENLTAQYLLTRVKHPKRSRTSKQK